MEVHVLPADTIGHLSGDQPASMVSLVVEDDGPGLPEGEATKDAAAAALSHAVG